MPAPIELKRRLSSRKRTESPPEAGTKFNLTDLGNAERFSGMHKHQVRYCRHWGRWLMWTGQRWMTDETGRIHQLAKETVRSIYAEAAETQDDERRKAIVKYARSSESAGKIQAMITLAQSEPPIPITPAELDTDLWLLNVSNGTIDLKSGELRKHKAGDYITKGMNVVCDPEAKCPSWDAFLERIMDGNSSLISFLQRAVGYSLTGDDSEQCIFLLYGTGANGKSSFLETIKFLLSDYAKQADFSTFAIRRSETVRNDVADLRGSRFVSVIEAESGQHLAESMVKQMTGGDTIKARFLFQEHFEFRPTFKIFLAMNHKPIIKGTDNAIWRRIRLVPFNVTIPEEERDLRLREKLKQELPGILNWALVGCAEWQENGLNMPQEVKSATDTYREEMDILSDFIGDCCLVDFRCQVTKSELWEAYEKWCESNGEEPLKRRTFKNRLIERGFKEDRTTRGSRLWKGIGLFGHNSPE